MVRKNLLLICFFIIIFLLFGRIFAYCQEDKTLKNEFAGEFSGWNAKVPLSNYYFVKGAISVFGTKWGAQPQTEQELEDRVWEQLVLSYEAFRRGIKAEDNKLNEEITKMLTAEKVKFDREKDRGAYVNWVKDRTKEPADLFENQLRHLIQLENLRKEVLDSFKPKVTEKEAHQEFLNEYNSLELELVQFDGLKDAEGYYKKMNRSALWEEEAKKNPKFAKHPGFVSLEFLREIWKIPEVDLYKMLKRKVNSIYPPTPIYKGYGVFRILNIRVAKEEDFPKVRESYFKQVEMIKKYEELKSWLKQLKQEARIKVYPEKADIKRGKNK